MTYHKLIVFDTNKAAYVQLKDVAGRIIRSTNEYINGPWGQYSEATMMELIEIPGDWDGHREPPPGIEHVVDMYNGNIADRVKACEWCEGSYWQYRHNGQGECWMDIDGIGPWAELTEL